MKIKIPSNLAKQKYVDKKYITDDTRELDKDSLLIRTKGNEGFVSKVLEDFCANPLDSSFCDSLTKSDLKDSIITPKELAAMFAPLPSLVAITGTNGKTTTAAIIYSILLDLGYTCGLLGTRGAYKNDKKIRPKGLTTPSLLELYEILLECRDCDFVIMEVSSHAIVQERVAGLEFASKVLTNITSDHLDYHKTLEEYVRVKNSFLIDWDNLSCGGSIIINADEPNAWLNDLQDLRGAGKGIIKDVFRNTLKNSVLYYAIEQGRLANLKADAYSLDNGISAHISFVGKCGGSTRACDSEKSEKIDRDNTDKKEQKISEQTLINAHLYGKHNLYNILAAILCVKSLKAQSTSLDCASTNFIDSKNSIDSISMDSANHIDSTCQNLAKSTNHATKDLHISLESIGATLQNFGGVEGRMEVVSHYPLIIVDFAHTHDGMEQIFESFRGREIAVVFGAGGDRDRTKRPKMGLCAYKYAKKLYITSDNPRSENPQSIIEDILSGIPKPNHRRVVCEIDRAEAIAQAINELESGEILLILGKGDETYQILGERSIEFDDREVVREVLSRQNLLEKSTTKYLKTKNTTKRQS